MGIKKDGNIPLTITYSNNKNETIFTNQGAIRQFVMKLVDSGEVFAIGKNATHNTERELVDALQTTFRNYGDLEYHPELNTKMSIKLIQLKELMSDVEAHQELLDQLNSNISERGQVKIKPGIVIMITINEDRIDNTSEYFIHNIGVSEDVPVFKKIVFGTDYVHQQNISASQD